MGKTNPTKKTGEMLSGPFFVAPKRRKLFLGCSVNQPIGVDGHIQRLSRAEGQGLDNKHTVSFVCELQNKSISMF